MNERIKEIAKQAGYYLYDLTETHECKTVETDSTDEWVTLEKFAQLIASDIIGAIRGLQQDAQVEGLMNIADTCDTIAGLIEMDYGVKND